MNATLPNRPANPTEFYGVYAGGPLGPLNPEHGVCRFLAVTYGRACNWHAHAMGPGLKTLERVEAAYQERVRHLRERHPEYAQIVHWLRHATPTDVQRELESGWLADGGDVWTAFGQTRYRLWAWAERDRQTWVASAATIALLGAAWSAQASKPRANPIPEEEPCHG